MTDAAHTAFESDVLRHLDEDALVEDLASLVRVPSMGGTDAEVEVQDLCADILRGEGADVDRWDLDLDELMADPWFPGTEAPRTQGVGVVGTTAGEGTPALVLQGHLDVVPPGDPETWQGTDPFSAEIRGNALYGRGACDMKAGVAANLAVVRTLRAAGVRLGRPLAVHCVVGEEDGGLGAFATLRRGHRGDAAVITEPTSGRIVTATAGALTFRIEVGGRSAHGSMRREGVSAFEAFLPVYDALRALEAERNVDPDPLFGSDLPYALSVGLVAAGDWASNVPDKLTAEGRLGVQLDEDPRQARLALEDAVAEASAKDPWLRENRPVVTWPGAARRGGLRQRPAAVRRHRRNPDPALRPRRHPARARPAGARGPRRGGAGRAGPGAARGAPLRGAGLRHAAPRHRRRDDAGAGARCSPSRSDRGSGGREPAVRGPGHEPVRHGERDRPLVPVVLPEARADELGEPLRGLRALGLERAQDLTHLVEHLTVPALRAGLRRGHRHGTVSFVGRVGPAVRPWSLRDAASRRRGRSPRR